MRPDGASNCGRESASMTGKLRLHKVRPSRYIQFNNLKYT